MYINTWLGSVGVVKKREPEFSVVPVERTRGDGHKLRRRKFCLNRRKQTFSLWGWPWTAMLYPHRLWSFRSWSYSKPSWAQPAETCCRWHCSEQGRWPRCSPGVPFNLSNCVTWVWQRLQQLLSCGVCLISQINCSESAKTLENMPYQKKAAGISTVTVVRSLFSIIFQGSAVILWDPQSRDPGLFCRVYLLFRGI